MDLHYPPLASATRSEASVNLAWELQNTPVRKKTVLKFNFIIQVMSNSLQTRYSG